MLPRFTFLYLGNTEWLEIRMADFLKKTKNTKQTQTLEESDSVWELLNYTLPLIICVYVRWRIQSSLMSYILIG